MAIDWFNQDPLCTLQAYIGSKLSDFDFNLYGLVEYFLTHKVNSGGKKESRKVIKFKACIIRWEG